MDPEIIVKPTRGQIDDLLHEINLRVERGERVLVTTLTKKMSEDLTDFLLERQIKVQYLHSEVETLRRIELLRELRLGTIDVLVGINLLREGLDLPEVSLVAILDADKAGFLRSATSLIQTIGRAARNVSGQVIMYADAVTPAMAHAIEETNRRRAKQISFNTEHGIDPQPLRKRIADITDSIVREDADTTSLLADARAARGVRAHGALAAMDDLVAEIEELTAAMHAAAAERKARAAGEPPPEPAGSRPGEADSSSISSSSRRIKVRRSAMTGRAAATIRPPASRMRSCRAISSAASMFAFRIVSLSEVLPTCLPVLMSIAVSASISSMIR